jgi:hypothetical protein
MIDNDNIRFSYMRTPLYRYTFKNRRIREWVERHCEGLVLNLFAGNTRLNVNEIRNDLRGDTEADYHMDALDFVMQWEGEKFGTVLLDPPYAYRKSMELYDGAVSSPFNQIKNRIPDILDQGGIVITFGYHSNVMGKSRNFIQEHILLLSHGGAIHDTVAIIERKDDGITQDQIGVFF